MLEPYLLATYLVSNSSVWRTQLWPAPTPTHFFWPYELGTWNLGGYYASGCFTHWAQATYYGSILTPREYLLAGLALLAAHDLAYKLLTSPNFHSFLSGVMNLVRGLGGAATLAFKPLLEF